VLASRYFHPSRLNGSFPSFPLLQRGNFYQIKYLYITIFNEIFRGKIFHTFIVIHYNILKITKNVKEGKVRKIKFNWGWVKSKKQ